MINKTVDIMYDDEIFTLKIVDYKNPYLTIEYNNKIFDKKITTCNFLNIKIGYFINKTTSDFKVNIGKTFINYKNNFTIIDRKKIKGYKYYKYHCNICSYEDWIQESNLLSKRKNFGCSSCSGKKTILGFNTIWDKARWMCDLGVSKYDAKNHTLNSHEKIKVICPLCKNEKYISIAKIYNYKSICCICSDGYSYPEKFMYSLLKQLNIDFITQYSPTYLENKKSDFYIKSLNLVIETDGELGHKDGKQHSKSNKTIEESIIIDEWKDRMHKLNGIETIRIKCFESTVDYIKNSILNSKLNTIFNLDNINWNMCEQFALKNIIYDVCKYWSEHENITTGTVANLFNITDSTVRKYLKLGSKYKWCEYEPKIGNPRRRNK